MAQHLYEKLKASALPCAQIFQSNYVLDCFQREPSWSHVQIESALLQGGKALLDATRNQREVDVTKIGILAMGQISIAPYPEDVDSFGNKHVKYSLVDGQQRITYTSMLINGVAKLFPTVQLGSLKPLRYDPISGEQIPVISAHNTKNAFKKIYTATEVPKLTLASSFDEKHLVKAQLFINNEISKWKMTAGEAQNLIDAIAQRMVFTVMETTLEDAPYMFIKINTNNTSLLGYQVVKGLIAGSIEDKELGEEFSIEFMKRIEKIQTLGIARGKMEGVITSCLRSKFGTVVGTVDEADFEMLTKNPGTWFANNADFLGYNSSEKFINLGASILAILDAYVLMLEAQETFNPAMENVFMLQDSGANYKEAAILSPIVYGDTVEMVKAKMELAAQGYIILTHAFDARRKSRTDGAFRKITVDFMKAIRNKPNLNDLAIAINTITASSIAEIEKEGYALGTLLKEYNHTNTVFTRNALQRIEHALAKADGTLDAKKIWKAKDCVKSLEPSIEHMVSNNFFKNDVSDDFDELMAEDLRAMVALQGILSVGVNAQLNDKELERKLDVYFRDSKYLGLFSKLSYNDAGLLKSVGMRKLFEELGVKPSHIVDGILTRDKVSEINALFNALFAYVQSPDRVVEAALVLSKRIANLEVKNASKVA